MNAADLDGTLAAERHIARERRGGGLDEIPPMLVGREPSDRPAEPMVAE